MRLGSVSAAVAAAALVGVVSSTGLVVRAQCGQTTVFSRQGNGASNFPSLSADGRYIAFDSIASDLVPGDAYGYRDVFVYDRASCATERVSVSSSGAEADQGATSPSISDDGRYVAFQSLSTNLVSGDTNGLWDVFVRDRLLGTTIRASVDSGGAQAAGGGSFLADVSGDGQHVAFVSAATNLVAGDTNGEQDAFVRDLAGGTTERVSVSTSGAQGESSGNSGVLRVGVSLDGRYVAFDTAMDGLVGGDTNGGPDVFWRDRQTGTTIRASVTLTGDDGFAFNPSISGDGRYVAFASAASNLVPGDTNGHWDVFIRDTAIGTTERVSLVNQGGEGNDYSNNPSISDDGRYVAFTSAATNLVVGDTNGFADVFVRDRQTGTSYRVSTSAAGVEGDAWSIYPALSASGLFVAFESAATNLVTGDTNGVGDVFGAMWRGISAPPDVELIRNGNFAGGSEFWLPFATPDMSYITWDTVGTKLRFYRTAPPPGTTNQAVVFQRTTAQLPPWTPLVASFRLANSSSARKRISVLIHDADFSDLHVCTFWLEPFQAEAVYGMGTHTTNEYWSDATISFYAASTGSAGGFYEVDDVSLRVYPSNPSDRTLCADPNRPSPVPGAPLGPQLIVNGNFSAGLVSWALFGQITTFVSGGVLNFIRPPGQPAGAVLQMTSQSLAANQIMEARFSLGNSSTVRKRVTIVVHEWDFSDLAACTFWLPPGQPLSSYVVVFHTTKVWTNATFSVYPATIGPEEWTRLDDVVLRTAPSYAHPGTDCYEPAPVPIAGASAASTAGLTIAGRYSKSTGEARAPQIRLAEGGSPVPVTGARAGMLEMWLAPHDTDGEIHVSTDRVSWRVLGFVPASDDWQVLVVDVSAWDGAVVYVRWVRSGEMDRR